MPSVRDLLGIRQTFGDGFTVAAAAIAGDNGYRGMSCKPGTRCLKGTVWQQGNRFAPLQIANDRPVGLTPPKGEVVDADDIEFIVPCKDASPYDPQQGVLAHGRHQALGKSGSIICDLERRRRISLLRDREPATAQSWLTRQVSDAVAVGEGRADTGALFGQLRPVH